MSEKLLQHPAALCNQLRPILIEAGAITLDYFDEGGCGFERKNDLSPVTLADQKAEDYIKHALNDFLPGIPMIGEEHVEAGKTETIGDSPYFWLVDPLDGTKEFIRGHTDFTVNIALIRGNEPWIGLVYAPALGELYGGYGPGTAFRWNEDTGHQKSIQVRRPPKEGLTVVTSRSHANDFQLESYLQQFKVRKKVKRGSSLKICLIAAGKADLYPRFGPTCEWDTAAAHAVLNAAGGSLFSCLTKEEFTYGHNREGKWLNPDFIASSERFYVSNENAGPEDTESSSV